MDVSDDLLQSEGWERFQRALGRRTERVGGVLRIRMPLPLGLSYWYSPRGGTASSRQPQATSTYCETLCVIADGPRALFSRGEFTEEQLAACSLQLAAPAVTRRQVEPEWTWRTSLDGSDGELLARMHEKHRYNIRVAMRHGVGVRRQTSGTFGDKAWRLLQETAKRQGISTHPRSYYETMMRVLPDTKLYIAEHDGAPLAAAIVAHYGDTATYLHGGSSYEHRQHMAPHLLHWTAMRAARDAGMRWYDWGGTSPPRAGMENGEWRMENSDWAGITRFKCGFGGEAVHHSPTRDLVFRPRWYRMLSWLARLRP